MNAFPFSSLISIVLSPLLVMAPLWAQTPTLPAPNVSVQPDVLQLRILNADSLRADGHPNEKQSVAVEVTDSSGAAVANAAVTCRLPDSGATGTFGDGTHAAIAYTDAQGRTTIEGVQWSNVAGPVMLRVTAAKGTAHTGTLIEKTLVTATSDSAGRTPVVTTAAVSAQPESTVVVVPMPVSSQANPEQPVVSQPTVSVTKPLRQPGQLAGQPAVNSKLNGAATNAADPTVSVTHTAAADAPHSSHLKWIILAAVVAAAGAGAAFAMKGKSSSSSSSTPSSVSIGAPTVSVGNP